MTRTWNRFSREQYFTDEFVHLANTRVSLQYRGMKLYYPLLLSEVELFYSDDSLALIQQQPEQKVGLWTRSSWTCSEWEAFKDSFSLNLVALQFFGPSCPLKDEMLKKGTSVSTSVAFASVTEENLTKFAHLSDGEFTLTAYTPELWKSDILTLKKISVLNGLPSEPSSLVADLFHEKIPKNMKRAQLKTKEVSITGIISDWEGILFDEWHWSLGGTLPPEAHTTLYHKMLLKRAADAKKSFLGLGAWEKGSAFSQYKDKWNPQIVVNSVASTNF